MEIGNIEKNNDVVAIEIENLSVWTYEEKSLWQRKVTKPSIRILNNISGRIKPSEFVAVLGPSGAGKTTLLVSIAGKCRLPRNGTVTVNGEDIRLLDRVVEIVPQFDIFMPGLSVMEHLIFMTELTVGSCKLKENKKRLQCLLADLKLDKISQTNVTDLSGGERRLLSLATSLLTNPDILVCDEPTTGLDSYNAFIVIGALKKLSLYGKVVICSVHQPSTDLFKAFNSIILMAEGRLLFHGTHEECDELFQSINLHCPANYNPADFYIRVLSNLQSSTHVERILDEYRNRFSMNGVMTKPAARTKTKTYKGSWVKEVQLLLWRSSLTLQRDVKEQIIQLFSNIIVTAIVVSTFFAGVSGTTQRGIQDMSGLLWLMTSETSFIFAYSSLFAFEAELPLFKREVGTYSCSSYLACKFFSCIPRCVVWPMLTVVIMTLFVDLPNHALTSMGFLLTLIVSGLTASAYGLGMAALFTSSGLLGDVMPCVDLPLFLMSGVFRRIALMPIWLHVVRYLSHFYYTMDAMSNIYWRQISHIDCVSNLTGVCDGAAVLAEVGYSQNFVTQDSLGLLFLVAFWIILAYFGLKREERRGYAY
ncbi:hypothetical protein ACJJTC_015611 [Scirpophaga incertulas]